MKKNSSRSRSWRRSPSSREKYIRQSPVPSRDKHRRNSPIASPTPRDKYGRGKTCKRQRSKTKSPVRLGESPSSLGELSVMLKYNQLFNIISTYCEALRLLVNT